MKKQLTLTGLILVITFGCEPKKPGHSPDSTPGTTRNGADVKSTAARTDCDFGPLAITIAGPGKNADVISQDDAFDKYSRYKKRILKREAMIDSFCRVGSSSQFKFLKCAHFPAKTIADHICIQEASLRAIYPAFDPKLGGIRLYPIQKGPNGNDQKEVRFLLIFTKKEPVPGTSSDSTYNDIASAPILSLRSDRLKARICQMGEHKAQTDLEALSAHLLCTPRCPGGNDATLLFDY